MRFQIQKLKMIDVIEQFLFDDRNKKKGSVTIVELH